MTDTDEIRSYTAARGPAAWAREASQLLRRSVGVAYAGAERAVSQCREVEAIVTAQTGVALVDRDALEIGAGQLPRQAAYFALHNRLTAIDLDVVPEGFDPAGYLRLLRRNGPQRFLKTLARKTFGVDRRFRAALARTLHVTELPRIRSLPMDAAAMTFADGSFDFVYSFDVFEHLPDPAAVTREALRVLRPGGVFLAFVHLFTCDSGAHDLRLYLPDRGRRPFWAHLRDEHLASVQTYAYLNRKSLSDWRDLAARELPGATITPFTVETNTAVRAALPTLRTQGALADFSDEELLTDRLIVIWKKSEKI